jgi:hypothetical protein
MDTKCKGVGSKESILSSLLDKGPGCLIPKMLINAIHNYV